MKAIIKGLLYMHACISGDRTHLHPPPKHTHAL